MDGPGITVADKHAVQHHVFGIAGKEQAGTPGDVFLFGVLVPVTVLRVGVDRALAGDGYILSVDNVDQRGKAVQRVAFPGRQVVLGLFIAAGEHAGQNGILFAVGAAQQGAAFLKVQRRVALQKQALGAVGACGHIDRAACRAGGQCRLQLGRVVSLAVRHKAVAGSIDKKTFLGRGKAQRFGLAADGHSQLVGTIRLQREKGKYVCIPLQHLGTVQQHRVGCRCTVACIV